MERNEEFAQTHTHIHIHDGASHNAAKTAEVEEVEEAA